MKIEFPAPEQIPSLKQLWKAAFNDPDDFIHHFFSTAFDSQRCLCAMENGVLAAALYWLDCDCRGKKMAYLYAVATDADHRRRGICTALMANAHERLRAAGYSGALLVPGSAGLRAFYKGMGYRCATAIREFSCDAADAPTSLRPVGTEEYAHLRRQFLPDGGVLQEGPSLSFLEKQAALYAGSNFLLACRREGDSLFALELLGNASAAPHILAALGVPLGRFRTPGGEQSFAMYLPFDQSSPPKYFGFAFD